MKTKIDLLIDLMPYVCIFLLGVLLTLLIITAFVSLIEL